MRHMHGSSTTKRKIQRNGNKLRKSNILRTRTQQLQNNLQTTKRMRGNSGEKMKGRTIFEGQAKGKILYSSEPISFYGGINPDTGIITEKNHPLEGQSITQKILVFPYGKGSTVGSYALYRLKKNKKAPLAIIMKETEPIVAVGAIISEIPCMDKININQLKTGQTIQIKISQNNAQIIK
jgi:uncharacterized protein